MNIKLKIESLIEEKKFTEARNLILENENDFKDDPEFYCMKAVIELLEENLDKAQDILNQGLMINPVHFDLLYNLAYVYKIKNDYLAAIDCYEKALINTTLPEMKELILNELESVQYDINELVEAQSKDPLVSIVLLAYNKLEYTQLCIESILKYTSQVNYELITVNNGSSDGTLEFFESIPNAKVVNLKENVGPVNGFNAGILEAKGKYTACVCNDFIFTPNWLDNILKCIESDETIGFVSPGASNVGNYQNIKGEYNNIGEMLEFAEKYNVSDPSKWEERVRLLPCVLLVRTNLLKEIGMYDPRFYFGEFADDDISFRIRRSGYKILFCKDTFTFHFGSVTTGEDQLNNNSLQVSREIFKEKYGLDAWYDAGFNIEMINASVDLVKSDQTDNYRILGINTKCGGNPLQLKNYLREKGISNISITNFCLDSKYKIDLDTVSDSVVEGTLFEITNLLNSHTQDFIILELQLDLLDQSPELISDIFQLLEEDGNFALSLETKHLKENELKKLLLKIESYGLRIEFQKIIPNSINGQDVILVGKRGS